MRCVRPMSIVAALVPALALMAPLALRAEEVRIAGSFGLCYLPVNVAIANKLIEKHAAAAGIADVKVSFQQLASGPAVNDAVLSGSAHIGTAGVSVMLNLWDKTVGRSPVKGMMAMCDSPIYF